jgi:hypothetical protein
LGSIGTPETRSENKSSAVVVVPLATLQMFKNKENKPIGNNNRR